MTIKIEKERLEGFNSELKQNPPLPPWLKHPSYSSTDLFWRTGKGENYLSEYLHVYFTFSSIDEINDYKLMYPEPKGWDGWYD